MLTKAPYPTVYTQGEFLDSKGFRRNSHNAICNNFFPYMQPV